MPGLSTSWTIRELVQNIHIQVAEAVSFWGMQFRDAINLRLANG
jgi:hypothetical protein